MKFSGKITLGAKFNSRKEFTDIWSAEVFPYFNGYQLGEDKWNYLKDSSSNAIENVKTFVQKYVVSYEKAVCYDPDCPWCFSEILYRNADNIMRSSFVIDKLNITHNHPNQKARWVEFGTMEDAVDQLEDSLTNENMADIENLCNETCRILMENNEVNLRATYLYALKYDAEQQKLIDQFSIIKSKMLSPPQGKKS